MTEADQRFRAPGELIAGGLNRVAHVYPVCDDRPGERRNLLAPVPVAVDRCKWGHAMLTIAPVKPLILDEIGEVFAFTRLFAETLYQSALGIDHFMGLELDVIVLNRRHACPRRWCDGLPIDEILHRN